MALPWSDKWNDQCLQHKYPRLFSFALDQKISVQDAIQTEDLSQLFYLPLYAQAYDELLEVQNMIHSLTLNGSGKDCWKTIWKDGSYSANKFYNHTFRHQIASLSFHVYGRVGTFCESRFLFGCSSVTCSIPRICFGEEIVMSPTFTPIQPTILE
jgi:hypothetical protein